MTRMYCDCCNSDLHGETYYATTGMTLYNSNSPGNKRDLCERCYNAVQCFLEELTLNAGGGEAVILVTRNAQQRSNKDMENFLFKKEDISALTAAPSQDDRPEAPDRCVQPESRYALAARLLRHINKSAWPRLSASRNGSKEN